MTDQETIEAGGADASKPAKEKTRAKAKKNSKAKAETKAKTSGKAKKTAKAGGDFDFVGKVESLLVKSGDGFTFAMRGRHGKRRSFRFDPADAQVMNAMAHLVLAAHASDSKIGVRTGAEVAGALVVREIESRPKIGKGR